MVDGRTGQRTLTVGTSSVVVSRLQPIAQRKLFVLTNSSTGGQIIYISFSKDATSSDLPIYPGGSYDEPFGGQTDASNDDIYAIANLAGGTLAITERTAPRGV